MNRRHIVFFCLAIMVLAVGTASGAAGDVAKIKQAIAAEGAKWQADETPYTNLNWEQKTAMLGLLPGYADEAALRRMPQFSSSVAELDEEVDWRNRNGGNWVTPVRNQGQCGSCWAFGGIAAMEAQILIRGNAPGYPLDLSEQYLVSCSGGSCNGWWADATLDFLQSDGTVDEPCLPYGATDNITCSERCDDWYYRNMKLESWGWCANVAQMKAALNEGPISSCFTVYDDFMSYGGGVYQHVWGGEAGGHMISIVGYSDSQGAWICKNSWGSSWGMAGYFMIRMGYDECGIESWAPLWNVPAEMDYPNLTVASNEIQETIGDGDGVLNPGETASLFLFLQNAPLAGSAQGVTAQIATSDPRITITDNISDFPNLSGGQVVSNSDPFALAVAPNCALGAATFTVYISANESEPMPYYVERTFTLTVSLNQAGYPIPGFEVDASAAICDLDDDDDLDVISADFDGQVRVTDGAGNMADGFPYDAQGLIKASPAVADLDGNGSLEIVIAQWTGHLHIINHDGSAAISPITLPIFLSAAPALGDLDGNGDLEIVQGCWDGKMYAFHHNGSPVAGFPYLVGPNMAIQEGALLLNIAGDSKPEIIFAAYDTKLYAITGQGQLLWSFALGALAAGGPTAADLGDGTPTIIMPDQAGWVHYLSPAGDEIRAVNLGHGCKAGASFGDINNDGILEIAVNDQAGYVHALTPFGEEMDGFPVATGSSVWASSSFSDLDNDGYLDMLIPSNSGALHAINHTGSELNGFPMFLSGGSRCTASIINLDQDGDLEIILGTFYGLDAIDFKETAGRNDCWNTYRGNARRTGYYGDGFFAVSVGQKEAAVLPSAYALYPAHPNPFNPVTIFSFQLPQAGPVALQVYDLQGRLVQQLQDGWKDAGAYQIAWDAAVMASGIYFCRMQAGDFKAVQKVMLMK